MAARRDPDDRRRGPARRLRGRRTIGGGAARHLACFLLLRLICRGAPLAEHSPRSTAMSSTTSERRWAYVVAGVVFFVFAVIVFTGVHWAAQPPSNVETIDAGRLHLVGEFVEANLGTELQPDGSAIVRVIAQQYSFVPSCIVVPADTRGRFPCNESRRRARIPHHRHQREQHGGPRVHRRGAYALRPKPGDHLMPCHEYCSVGHEGMWARVKVVDRHEFARSYGSQTESILCTVVAASSSPTSGPPSRCSP